MIVLGFDTATPETVVALTGAGPPVELRHSPPPGERPGHAHQLLPLATEALRRAGISWSDLDRIGVGVGPGSFTGLRIGVATARALGQAAGAELAGVCTLQALAAAVHQGPAPDAPPWTGAVLAVVGARRGEAFVAAWKGDRCLRPPEAVAVEQLGACVSAGGGPWLAIGESAVRFRSELESAGASVPADGSPLHRVSGLAVCRLAERTSRAERDTLVPEYVRAPDAELRARPQINT